MSYDDLRHLADSYGLLFLGFVFLVLIGWTFRKGARRNYERAATMIFDEEDRQDG
jgi:cytochrome c oxidase cbb3-type subunit 4